ncbi:hypothetical protein MLPF_2527 [Mycobacterium lepromatosis]|nr:hypothetical protein MLPF_2527 [Mycobacterium lepromatosis]
MCNALRNLSRVLAAEAIIGQLLADHLVTDSQELHIHWELASN